MKMTDREAYSLYPDDGWIYDKIYVAGLQNIRCGYSGAPIPYDGNYCVKPIRNLDGCSIGSHIVENMMFWTPPFGSTWFEYIDAIHWTADFIKDETGNWIATNKFVGILNEKDHRKFDFWIREEEFMKSEALKEKEKVSLEQVFNTIPKFLKDVKQAPIVNLEFRGNIVIDAHLRPNSDPVEWDCMKPVWGCEPDSKYLTSMRDRGFEYIPETENHVNRFGFFVKKVH